MINVKKTNLDALVPREDFEVKDLEASPTNKSQNLKITDLEKDSFFFGYLRKPDFQRETNEWDHSRVFFLIDSFLNGDLIPAVIMWKNEAGFTFVIDGAHRLSALAAWVNDDYGDGAVSKQFYDSAIPDEQLEAANKLRAKINKELGPYSDYKLAMKNPEKVKPEVVNKARLLGSLAIQIQWVDGDAKKAEASFFKINQKAAPIDQTELVLLKSRNKPNGIATRAVLRSGKGHKYWSVFTPEKQAVVQELAKDINNILFDPPLKSPLKTLDVPVAGKSFSSKSQMLVLEFVNSVNDIDEDCELPDDTTGDATIGVLRNCLSAARLINSNDPSSLGLHPAIYFYAKNGRYKPASFSFFLQLMLELRQKRKLNDFISVRHHLESIILEYEDFPRQIVRKYRTSKIGEKHVVSFYNMAINHLKNGKTTEDTIAAIISSPEFNYLTIRSDDENSNHGKNFNTDGKAQVFLNEALKNAIKCKICNGYLHRNSISIDHKIRKREGGNANPDNGQVTHPYCNTGFKN